MQFWQWLVSYRVQAARIWQWDAICVLLYVLLWRLFYTYVYVYRVMRLSRIRAFRAPYKHLESVNQCLRYTYIHTAR